LAARLPGAVEERQAHLRVGAHERPLGLVERRVLAEDCGGDAELADVVHEAGAGEHPELGGAHRHLPPYVDAEPRDAKVVGARLAVLDLEAERDHRVEPGSDLVLYRRICRCRGTSSRTSSGCGVWKTFRSSTVGSTSMVAKNGAQRL